MTENNNVVKVPTSQLKPNVYNPNQQSVSSFELLCKSIQEDGFTLPVVVNSGASSPALTDMIIDGEHRWRAALVLGMPEVPIVYKDMDEAQMRVSTIRHNKARGHHDVTLEAKVLAELVGEIGVDELSEGLGIDLIELEVMTMKAQDYTAAEEVGAVLEESVLAGLAEQGLEGASAQIVAHRHGVIGATGIMNQQNSAQLEAETGQNVRIDFVFSGEDAETMRTFVQKHGSAHDAITFAVRFAMSDNLVSV